MIFSIRRPKSFIVILTSYLYAQEVFNAFVSPFDRGYARL